MILLCVCVCVCVCVCMVGLSDCVHGVPVYVCVRVHDECE